MAAMDLIRPATPGLSVGGRITSKLQNVGTRFVAWREARQTAAQLYRLSDRELDDVGLSRGDIEKVARGSL